MKGKLISLQKLQGHKQWPHVVEIVRILRKNGYQALLAGGCVRDAVLGRIPQDFDIATSAAPDAVEALFPDALGVGRQFGVMVLPFKGFQVEVATFRSDGPYLDGRHPSSVTFSSPQEDAARRDFTINSMFLDPEAGQVIDYFNGLNDIEAGIVKTVGDPERRFEEDKLRTLRAIRFAVQLDFAIEAETYLVINQKAASLRVVSGERITSEFTKILLNIRRVAGLNWLVESGLLELILPELYSSITSYELSGRWRQSKYLLEALGEEKRLELILAALFLPWIQGNEKTHEKFLDELKRLKFSNQILKLVEFTLQNYPKWSDEGALTLAQRLRLLAHEAGTSLLDLWTVDRQRRGLSLQPIESLVSEYGAMADSQGRLPQPLLRGDDLLGLGYKNGPGIGAVLKRGYDLQLEGQLTTKQQAIDWAKNQRPG